MAARHNLVVEQGATLPLYVKWQDPDGDAIDLTGFRIKLQVRQSASATTTLLNFDSGALLTGMHIGTLGATGIIDITIDPVVTSALAFKNAEWDLTATSSGGYVYRLLEGKASVLPAVTR